MTATTSSPAPPFADVLQAINHGAVSDQVSAQLADLVQQVSHTGRKGSLTLTVEIAPFTGGGNTVQVSAATVVKPPKNDPHAGVFFFDDKGALSRNDPTQPALFTEKEAAE